MRLKLLGGAAALLITACTLGSGPAAAQSVYYPWAWQFPWDRPGTVNPDIMTGWMLSTSAQWPALTSYGAYNSTLGPSRACRHGRCRDWYWYWW